MMQTPEFVQLKTLDGLTLPGLLFKTSKSKKAAIYLHGNGSSSVFYYTNYYFAEELVKRNISLLMFNNRGAHYIKKIDVEKDKIKERKRYGMAYEKIKECTQDIDGAINFLQNNGFKEFYLIGASTGANKICVYNYYKPKNKFSKYVLIAGGDDTGIYYNLFGKDKFLKLLKESKEKIKKGEGEDLICELLPEHIFSYIGFYDIANPDGDYNVFPYYETINNVKLSTKPLFRHFKSIKKPSLIIYGEKDEYVCGDTSKVINILKRMQPKFTYKIVKRADHGFTNYERELARIFSNYLASN